MIGSCKKSSEILVSNELMWYEVGVRKGEKDRNL